MNSLTHWSRLDRNQLNELEDLQHSLGSLFNRSRFHWSEGHESVVRRLPLMDISEDAKGYLLKAALPQVKAEDVKITMEDGTLTITGGREFEQNSKKDHQGERVHGSFVHRFPLPPDANRGQVIAQFRDGVLKVFVAKNETSATETETAPDDQILIRHGCSSGWGINE